MFSSFTYAFLYMEPMSQVKKKKNSTLVSFYNSGTIFYNLKAFIFMFIG